MAKYENDIYDERPIVMIADDDMNFRLLARKALEVVGFRVEEAEDGVQLMENYDRVQPDVILLDIMMPNMDGFTACAKLRERPEGQYIPIMMVTGLDDMESVSKAYEVGATDFITKPINWLILSHRVRFMLRTKHLIDEIVQNELQALAELYVIPDLLEEKSETRIDPTYVEWGKNLRALERIAGKDVLERVIRSYLENTPALIQTLAEAIAKQDFEILRNVATELKLNSTNLGASKIVSLCRELESVKNADYLAAARSVVTEIENEFDHLQNFLRQEFLT